MHHHSLLFTLDKLISQLLKQTIALVGSDFSLQLLCLYEYEMMRAKSGGPITLERSAQLCRQYQSNAQSVLNGENIMQIEYFLDNRELGIGLIEHVAINESRPFNNDLNKFVDYFLNSVSVQNEHNNNLTQTPSHSNTDKPFYPPPFIRKNIKSFSSSYKIPSVSTVPKGKNPPINVDHLSILSSSNLFHRFELEFKVSLKDYKIHYVEDTNDFMCRNKRRKLSNSVKCDTQLVESIESKECSSLSDSIITSPRRDPPVFYIQQKEKRQNSREKNLFRLRNWHSNTFNTVFPGLLKELEDRAAKQAEDTLLHFGDKNEDTDMNDRDNDNESNDNDGDHDVDDGDRTSDDEGKGDAEGDNDGEGDMDADDNSGDDDNDNENTVDVDADTYMEFDENPLAHREEDEFEDDLSVEENNTTS